MWCCYLLWGIQPPQCCYMPAQCVLTHHLSFAHYFGLVVSRQIQEERWILSCVVSRDTCFTCGWFTLKDCIDHIKAVPAISEGQQCVIHMLRSGSHGWFYER